MFGSGSEENTKTRCVWLVNGVSVLTYEFFSKTAPSDNLSMRPAREMEPACVCVKAGGKSALSSLERQDCKCVFLPSALLSYMLPSCCCETSGGGACNCLSFGGRGLVSSWHRHVTPFSYYQWETSSCRAESTAPASVCQVVKCKFIDKQGMGNAKQDYVVLSFFKTPKCCILTVYI